MFQLFFFKNRYNKPKPKLIVKTDKQQTTKKKKIILNNAIAMIAINVDVCKA